jgi:hypothetical protein
VLLGVVRRPGEEGPPPHLHREHQEAFFVVSGSLTFTVPGGIEGFFVEMGEAMASGPPDEAELQRLSERYDVFFA